MAGRGVPVSNRIDGVRKMVSAMRARAASISSIPMGRTSSSACAMERQCDLCSRGTLVPRVTHVVAGACSRVRGTKVPRLHDAGGEHALDDGVDARDLPIADLAMAQPVRPIEKVVSGCE